MRSRRHAIRAFAMISKLFVAESRSFTAPENLAAEAFLAESAEPEEMILLRLAAERGHPGTDTDYPERPPESGRSGVPERSE